MHRVLGTRELSARYVDHPQSPVEPSSHVRRAVGTEGAPGQRERHLDPFEDTTLVEVDEHDLGGVR